MADKPYNLRKNPTPSLKAREASQLDDETQNTTPENIELNNTPTDERTITASPVNSDSSESQFRLFDEPYVFDSESDRATQYDNAVCYTERIAHNISQASDATGTSQANLSMEPATHHNTPLPPPPPAHPTRPSNTLVPHIAVTTTAAPSNESSLLEQIARLIETNSQRSRAEFKHDLQQIKSELIDTFEDKINDLRTHQSQIDLTLTKIQETQSNQSQEIDKIRTDVDYKIEACGENIRDQINQEFKQHKNSIINTINNKTQEIHTNINLQIQEQFDAQNKQIQDIKIKNLTQIELSVQKHTAKLGLSIQENQDQIQINSDKLTELDNAVTQCTTDIKLLKLNNSANISQLPTTINVTCNGSSAGTLPDVTLPKFHGRAINPKEYLSKLQKYYERGLTRITESHDKIEYLTDVIESSLENHASRWFCLIKNDIRSWEEFENAFLNKYWNRSIQKHLKQKLETDKYRPNGKLSRSEYFIERVITLQSFTPAMSEEEIVSCLAEHFNELIQDARRVQNINNITDFESLLQREDLKDATRRPRSPPNNDNTREEQYRYGGRQNNNYHQQHHKFNNAPSPPHNIDYRAYNPRPNDRHNDRPNNRYFQPNTHMRYEPYASQNRPRYNQHNERYRNEPHNTHTNDRRYPTPEQNKVCTTIVERTPAHGGNESNRDRPEN